MMTCNGSSTQTVRKFPEFFSRSIAAGITLVPAFAFSLSTPLYTR